MHQTNPWQSYRQVATQTASPGQLVLMLYDGAIRFLDQARAGFDKDDPLEFNQTIHNNILKAQPIINASNVSLDTAKGGELPTKLRLLYNYMDRRLHDSNVKKEPEGILDVIRRVTVLRDSWQQMLRNLAGADAAVGADSLSAA